MVEDAKPEQVQAVVPCSGGDSTDLLSFSVGEIITVLDKREEASGDGLWFGCLGSGRAGLFSPALTVAYIGALPAQAGNTRWQQEEVYQSGSTFARGSSLRGSKGRRKISKDLISGPRGEVQHTGHIGVDGAFFGDVSSFIAAGGNSSSGGGSGSRNNAANNNFQSMPGLSRCVLQHFVSVLPFFILF